MAVKKPLVDYAGNVKELQAGDSMAGMGIPISQPEDFATITHYTPLNVSGNNMVKILIRILELSDGKQLVITCNYTITSSVECYGTVYTPISNSWGLPTLLYTAAAPAVADENSISIKTIGTDRFLLVNSNSLSELQAKVLTVSNTTIGVGAAYTKAVTLSANLITQIVVAGSSYVISYQQSATLTSVLAITESAGVITFGAVVSFTVTSAAATEYLFPISATEVGIIYKATTTTSEVKCLTLAGTVITPSTPITLGGASNAWIVSFQKINTEYVVISHETGQSRVSFLQFVGGAVSARSLIITGAFSTGYTGVPIVNVGAGKYILIIASSYTAGLHKAIYISDDGTTVANTASMDFSLGSLHSIVSMISSPLADTADLVLQYMVLRFTYSGGILTASVLSFSKNSGASLNVTMAKGKLENQCFTNSVKAFAYSKTLYAGIAIDSTGQQVFIDFSSFPPLSVNQIMPRFHELDNTAIGYSYANANSSLYIVKGELI